MQNYQWPGNVRELENVVQRALILQHGEHIVLESLVFEGDMSEQLIANNTESNESIVKPVQVIKNKSIDNQKVNALLGDSVRSAEENIILQTLRDEDGSRKITAQKLGISPRTLRYKIARMKESGVPVPC
jgi:two-component system response regulator FlrC